MQSRLSSIVDSLLHLCGHSCCAHSSSSQKLMYRRALWLGNHPQLSIVCYICSNVRYRACKSSSSTAIVISLFRRISCARISVPDSSERHIGQV